MSEVPAMHCTALHYTALPCTALHCTAMHCTALHCTAMHSVLGDTSCTETLPAIYSTPSPETPAVRRHYLPSIPLRPRRHQLYGDITCHPFHSVLGDTRCTETLPTIYPTLSSETPDALRRYRPSIPLCPRRHQLY
jgi:hypothetical protein